MRIFLKDFKVNENASVVAGFEGKLGVSLLGMGDIFSIFQAIRRQFQAGVHISRVNYQAKPTVLGWIAITVVTVPVCIELVNPHRYAVGVPFQLEIPESASSTGSIKWSKTAE